MYANVRRNVILGFVDVRECERLSTIPLSSTTQSWFSLVHRSLRTLSIYFPIPALCSSSCGLHAVMTSPVDQLIEFDRSLIIPEE